MLVTRRSSYDYCRKGPFSSIFFRALPSDPLMMSVECDTDGYVSWYTRVSKSVPILRSTHRYITIMYILKSIRVTTLDYGQHRTTSATSTTLSNKGEHCLPSPGIRTSELLFVSSVFLSSPDVHLSGGHNQETICFMLLEESPHM